MHTLAKKKPMQGTENVRPDVEHLEYGNTTYELTIIFTALAEVDTDERFWCLVKRIAVRVK